MEGEGREGWRGKGGRRQLGRGRGGMDGRGRRGGRDGGKEAGREGCDGYYGVGALHIAWNGCIIGNPSEAA